MAWKRDSEWFLGELGDATSYFMPFLVFYLKNLVLYKVLWTVSDVLGQKSKYQMRSEKK